MKIFSKAVDVGSASTAEALEVFDSLDTVKIDFVFDLWKSVGFPTDHPLDGVLEVYHYHGKRFDNTEQIHPLVFKTLSDEITSVNSLWMMPAVSLPILKSKAVGHIFQMCISVFATRLSCARLRMTTYRGKESATTIYDALPINYIFCKVDENTVSDIMDLKVVKQPFFFVLRRE